MPQLIRRIADEIRVPEPDIAQPIRFPRNKVAKQREIQRVIELATSKLNLPGSIIILLDADTDCPAKLGPRLQAAATRVRNDRKMAVILAKHEFETWFLAAFPSLSGKRGLRENLPEIFEPETIRGAKERLQEFMMPGRNYSETIDQPALTSQFDMGVARQRSSSFDKFYREVEFALRG